MLRGKYIVQPGFSSDFGKAVCTWRWNWLSLYNLVRKNKDHISKVML